MSVGTSRMECRTAALANRREAAGDRCSPGACSSCPARRTEVPTAAVAGGRPDSRCSRCRCHDDSHRGKHFDPSSVPSPGRSTDRGTSGSRGSNRVRLARYLRTARRSPHRPIRLRRLVLHRFSSGWVWCLGQSIVTPRVDIGTPGCSLVLPRANTATPVAQRIGRALPSGHEPPILARSGHCCRRVTPPDAATGGQRSS